MNLADEASAYNGRAVSHVAFSKEAHEWWSGPKSSPGTLKSISIPSP